MALGKFHHQIVNRSMMSPYLNIKMCCFFTSVWNLWLNLVCYPTAPFSQSQESWPSSSSPSPSSSPSSSSPSSSSPSSSSPSSICVIPPTQFLLHFPQYLSKLLAPRSFLINHVSRRKESELSVIKVSETMRKKPQHSQMKISSISLEEKVGRDIERTCRTLWVLGKYSEAKLTLN